MSMEHTAVAWSDCKWEAQDAGRGFRTPPRPGWFRARKRRGLLLRGGSVCGRWGSRRSGRSRFGSCGLACFHGFFMLLITDFFAAGVLVVEAAGAAAAGAGAG